MLVALRSTADPSPAGAMPKAIPPAFQPCAARRADARAGADKLGSSPEGARTSSRRDASSLYRAAIGDIRPAPLWRPRLGPKERRPPRVSRRQGYHAGWRQRLTAASGLHRHHGREADTRGPSRLTRSIGSDHAARADPPSQTSLGPPEADRGRVRSSRLPYRPTDRLGSVQSQPDLRRSHP